MRVGIYALYTSHPSDPCLNLTNTYISYQDYGFEVLDVPSCVRPDELSVTDVIDFQAKISWNSRGNESQWEVKYSSDPNFDPDTDGESVNVSGSPSTKLNSLNPNTTYYLYIRSICSGEEVSSWSEDINFTTLLEGEHCLPKTSSVYYLSGFSTSGGEDNIDNVISENPDNGYADFYNQTVSQAKTELIHFEAGDIKHINGTSYNGGIRIWVDWNQDGEFSNNEIVYQSSSSSSTHIGSFEVPADAESGKTRMRIGLSYNFAAGATDPCMNTTLNTYAFQAYGFEVLDVPSCVRPNNLAATDITHSQAKISWNRRGNESQWEVKYSNDADFDPDTEGELVNASGLRKATLEDLEPETDYYVYVRSTCQNGQSSWSEYLLFTTLYDSGGYCIPRAPNNNTLYWIESVSFNAIGDMSNMDTGRAEDGYADYTSTHSITIGAGDQLDFEIKSENGAVPGIKIWIDWNQNNSFDDEGELVYETFSGSPNALNTYSGTIEVPAYASLGTTRMRIRNYSDQEPCNKLSYGETEDYSVEIIELDTCIEAIAGSVVGDTNLEVCVNSSIDLEVEGSTAAADGMIRTWQSSAMGENNWTNLNISTSTLNVDITEAIDFRYYVYCENGELESFSDVVSVSIKQAVDCYCIPQTNSNYYLSGFSTSGGETNIDNTISENPENGYADYFEQTDTQASSENISFEASMNSSTHGIRIWIDWNQDGKFTNDEIAYQSSGYSTNFNGIFTVPEYAILGKTRMRIGSHYLGSSGPTNPCENSTNISYQDYGFDVLPADYCVQPSQFTAVNINPTDATLKWQSHSGESNWTVKYSIDADFDPNTEGQTADNVSDASTILSDLNLATTYYAYVKAVCTPGTDESAWSDKLRFTTKLFDGHCKPITSASSLRYFEKFSTSGGQQNINNSIGSNPSNGFGDFYEQTASQTRTENISFEAKTRSGTAGIKIWIDLNQNGVFDEDEVVYQSSSYESTHNGTFEIPEDAVLGKTRLRLGYHFNDNRGPENPCVDSNSTDISFQDYGFEVLEEPICQRPSDLSAIKLNPYDATLSWTVRGEETQWEVKYSADANFDPDNEGLTAQNFQNSSAELTDLWEGVTYFAYVRAVCGVEEESSWSDLYSFRTPLEGNQCIPVTNSNYYLSSFLTSGGEENIDNTISDNIPEGFYSYYNKTVSQSRAETINFEAGEMKKYNGKTST